MRFKSLGRIKEFSARNISFRNMDDIVQWRNFMYRSERHKEQVSQSRPDIVARINESIRLAKEEDRQKEEKYKNGEWHYHGESDEWYWTGENEPEYGDDHFVHEAPTEEEKRLDKEAEERWMEAEIEERKHEKRLKREMKEREQREAMKKPLDPLPERELCDYEKLRESNINERQEAMAKCKFFQDLMEFKEEIGFIKSSRK